MSMSMSMSMYMYMYMYMDMCIKLNASNVCVNKIYIYHGKISIHFACPHLLLLHLLGHHVKVLYIHSS